MGNYIGTQPARSYILNIPDKPLHAKETLKEIHRRGVAFSPEPARVELYPKRVSDDREVPQAIDGAKAEVKIESRGR